MFDYMPIAQWLMARWSDSGKPGCFGCLFWLMAISVYLVLLPVDLVIGFIRWRGADGKPSKADEPEWEPKPDFYVHDEETPADPIPDGYFLYIDDDDLKTAAREIVDKANGLIAEARKTERVLGGERVPAHRYRVPKLDDGENNVSYERTGEYGALVKIEIYQYVEADSGCAEDEYLLAAFADMDGNLKHMRSEYRRGIRQSEAEKVDDWYMTTYVLEWDVDSDGEATLVGVNAIRE